MVSLEQVKLLETKVAKAIDYVRRVNEENSSLKEKMNVCQSRVNELEALVQRFKDDQSRIEEGIISALERLNQFEDAIEKGVSAVKQGDQVSIKPVQEETPPAADDESDEAIMAILEAEQEAVRTAGGDAATPKASPEKPEGGRSSAELDIF